jgi:hypothetical protein
MDSQHNSQKPAQSTPKSLRSILNRVKKGFSRLNVSRILAMICLCSVFSIALANLNYAYAVSIDGHILCYAADRTELTAVIRTVEETASDALGHRYTLDSDLTTKLSIGITETSSAQDLREILLGSIPEIRFLYVISLDGKTLCALPDEESAKEVVKKLLSNYINEDTVSASFIGDVVITGRYIRSDFLNDPESAYAVLCSSVEVVTQELVTVDEAVPYGVEIIEDNTLLTGETLVKSEGTMGKAVADYRTSYINGVQTEKIQESFVVYERPVNAVILQGTKERSKHFKK